MAQVCSHPSDKFPTICVSANTSWYLYNFRSELIKRLLIDGFHVNALSPHDQYVGRLVELGVRHTPLTLDNFGTNPLTESLAILRIANYLRRSRPDLLLTFTPKINIYGALAARMSRVPVLANISGLGHSFSSKGWVRTVTRILYGIALSHPVKVFFQNEEDRSEFITDELVRGEKTERLPGSGVDIARFQQSARQELRHRFVFLLAARLLWHKGIREFIEAARMVRAVNPSTEFWLAGFLSDNPVASVPAEYIQEWQDQGLIKFVGAIENMVDLYSKVDCVVLPSYYREGVPRSLLEAASMGLPIITTDLPGCRDAVEEGVTGFLCSPKSADSLADSMLKLLRLGPSERDAMGYAGRCKMLREFDEGIITSKYLREITEVLQRNKHVRSARC